MNDLQTRLDEIDAKIHLLHKEKDRMIAEEPRTFAHLGESWVRDRYSVVRADGVDLGYGWSQRPAADRRLRYACNAYGNNAYLFDRKLGTVTDIEGNVVHRVEVRA